MKDYKELLNEGAYQLDIDSFKAIPFPEFEKQSKFLGWLCYYEKTDIVKYCLEHKKYSQLIEQNSLLNDYCLSISLQKTNVDLIDYLLEKNCYQKEDIIKNLDSFLMGNLPVDYLPSLNSKDIKILGNKAIYHVKPIFLSLALKNGFNQHDINIENVFFCMKNQVDEEDKKQVLDFLNNTLNIREIINKDNEAFLKALTEIDVMTQCFEEVVSTLFNDSNLEQLMENSFWPIVKIINKEQQNNGNYLKNKVLLEYSHHFSDEHLQKIKKFNKDFYREIEKVRLYKDLQQKPPLSNFSGKKAKI